MKKIFGSLLIITSLTSVSLNAQETHKVYEDGFLSHYAVAAKISPYGPAIDFHTSILPNLKARIGFNYLAYTYDKGIPFTADDANNPSKNVSGKITMISFRFPNGNLLFDYYPIKSGFFRVFNITGGVYVGTNDIALAGTADGDFILGDIVVKPVDGKFDATARLGNLFKPYLGIGIGRTIPQSKFGYRVDLGIIYQGKYTVASDYAVQDLKPINEDIGIDLPFSDKFLEYCPMLSVSLFYRFK